MVRLRITAPARAQVVFKAMPASRRADPGSFSLGSLASIAGYDKGICTGTLIARNIVITAGHCVWVDHLMSKYKGGPENVPHYRIRDEPVALTDDEFSQLLIADFNYETAAAATSADSLAPIGPPAGYPSFEVRALVAVDRTPDRNTRLDFAILRIGGTPEQISRYAIGAKNLHFGTVADGLRSMIIQHYDGDIKQIATGAIQASRGSKDRVFDHVVSTAEGSSGASVMNAEGKVVGIHSDGGCDDPDYNTNQGLLLRAIAGPLKKALGLN